MLNRGTLAPTGTRRASFAQPLSTLRASASMSRRESGGSALRHDPRDNAHLSSSFHFRRRRPRPCRGIVQRCGLLHANRRTSSRCRPASALRHFEPSIVHLDHHPVLRPVRERAWTSIIALSDIRRLCLESAGGRQPASARRSTRPLLLVSSSRCGVSRNIVFTTLTTRRPRRPVD